MPFEREGAQTEIFERGLDAARRNFDFATSGLVVDEVMIKVCGRLYFAINREYKKFRIENGHNTQPTKIAGLTAASIMLVRPIFSVQESAAAFFSNPFFALFCGSAISGANFSIIQADTMMRLSGWIDTFRILESGQLIDKIQTCTRAGEFLSLEEMPLRITTSELFQLDMFVGIFELLTLGSSVVSTPEFA